MIHCRKFAPMLAIGLLVLAASEAPSNAQTAPTVATVPETSHGTVPSDLKVICLTNPNSLDASSTCPILQINGYTYWAYSYIDNRVGLAIVAYDPAGKVVKRWDKSGTRYIWQINLDPGNKNVAFVGQANGAITMTWDELTLPPLPAFPGPWKLGHVTNNTDQHVMFGFHVPAHGSVGNDALNELTMVGVLMDVDGVLSLDPHGATSGCANPQFRTELQFADHIWEFYYNAGTTLDITINPNQQFVFTPGPGGQVVPLGQAAQCH